MAPTTPINVAIMPATPRVTFWARTMNNGIIQVSKAPGTMPSRVDWEVLNPKPWNGISQLSELEAVVHGTEPTLIIVGPNAVRPPFGNPVVTSKAKTR